MFSFCIGFYSSIDPVKGRGLDVKKHTKIAFLLPSKIKNFYLILSYLILSYLILSYLLSLSLLSLSLSLSLSGLDCHFLSQIIEKIVSRKEA